ncbi:hypothetical protein ACWCOW_39420 [Streptomyces sp. NPDC001939]
MTIRPAPKDDSDSKFSFVHLHVTPRLGHEMPTLPLFPEGRVYTDRTGVQYTVLAVRVVEHGHDGEQSIWCYDYLAAIGSHRLSELRA